MNPLNSPKWLVAQALIDITGGFASLFLAPLGRNASFPTKFRMWRLERAAEAWEKGAADG